MGRALNGRGQVLVVTASFHHLGLEIRRKGFEGMLHERFPGVEIVDAVESPYDLAGMRAVTAAAIKRHPRLTGIYVTVGAGGAAQAVADAGLAGKVTIIGHDIMDEAMPYVARGVVTATIGQDPYAQGHDPVIHLFNHLAAGWQPPRSRLLTEADLVTPANIGQFWQAGKGSVESAAMAERRPRPMKTATRRIRIAVLGLEDAPFWEAVRNGVSPPTRSCAPSTPRRSGSFPSRRRIRPGYPGGSHRAAGPRRLRRHRNDDPRHGPGGQHQRVRRRRRAGSRPSTPSPRACAG